MGPVAHSSCVLDKKFGSEAAIHTMHTTFESDDTDVILLINTSNAFNELNRAATLQNIHVLYPIIAIYTINTYRQPARLFVIGGKRDCVSRRNNTGQSTCYGSTRLKYTAFNYESTSSVQCEALCWFADDASGAGFIMENRTWWDALTKLAQQEVRTERLKELEHRAEHKLAPRKTQRGLDLVAEKGSSAWLTVLPLQDLSFNLNKRESRDAVKRLYDWPVEDIPSTCARGEAFMVDYSMICKLGGFIPQRHN